MPQIKKFAILKKQLKEIETKVVLCCSPDVFWIAADEVKEIFEWAMPIIKREISSLFEA